jgi:hypothetical protein
MSAARGVAFSPLQPSTGACTFFSTLKTASGGPPSADALHAVRGVSCPNSPCSGGRHCLTAKTQGKGGRILQGSRKRRSRKPVRRGSRRRFGRSAPCLRECASSPVLRHSGAGRFRTIYMPGACLRVEASEEIATLNQLRRAARVQRGRRYIFGIQTRSPRCANIGPLYKPHRVTTRA